MSEEKKQQEEDVEDIFSSTEKHKESNIFKEMEIKELPKEEGVSEIVGTSEKVLNKKNKKIFIIVGVIVIALIFLVIYVISPKIKNIREERKILEKEKNANAILSQIKAVEQIMDSDKDGLSDDEEAQLGTNPLEVDSDKDGLSDRAEVKAWKTDPLNPDTDGDGVNDGDEVKNKTNPKGEGSLLETIQK